MEVEALEEDEQAHPERREQGFGASWVSLHLPRPRLLKGNL